MFTDARACVSDTALGLGLHWARATQAAVNEREEQRTWQLRERSREKRVHLKSKKKKKKKRKKKEKKKGKSKTYKSYENV